ncbi:MAG: hypothetical protein H7X95_10690 [Deltaproteobacteria bacterium]|nr:hypothetical protein [Deltaproteobacteria bacterium]
MKRFAFTMLLAGSVGTAVVSGLALAGDSAKCTIATSGESETAKACKAGGRAQAKKAMKKMVADAKAKDKSQKYTCEGCHKDLDNYELTKNSKEDFAKLEALLAKK